MPQSHTPIRRLYLRHALVILTVLVGFSVLVWTFVDSHRDLKRSLGKEALSHLTMEYDLLKSYQRTLAEEVVIDHLRTPAVVELMHQAATTTQESERARLRERLHARLLPIYERMKGNGFRQLHFHLPGAVSFLRFHRPASFGDDLWDVRAGLRLVNETHRPVFGFEEGRVYNGFRHIYPLMFEGEFVGSVEASFSFRTFLMHHVDLDDSLYRLILRRSLVDAKVWGEARERYYEITPLHPDYLRDQEADPFSNPALLPPAGDWSSDEVDALEAAVAGRAAGKLAAGRPFSLISLHPSPVVISALPVENTLGDTSAWVLRYQRAPDVAMSWRWMWLKIGIALGLLLLVLGTLVVLDRRDYLGNRMRARLLADLHAEHQRLEQAQWIARLGSWESDGPEGEIQWSDQVYDIFGVSPSTFRPTHESFMALVHPADRERVEQAASRSFATDAPYVIEHRVLCPDGQVRHVLERGVVETSEDGRRRMIGTVQDVSEQRELAETRLEAEAIIESAHEAIFVCDTEGRLQRCNASFRRLAGVDETEAESLTIQTLFRATGREDADDFDVAWREAREQGYWEGELSLIDRQDAGTPVLLSLTALTLDWGERRMVGLFSDISDIHDRERHMWHRAHHDPLTGAANRVLFHERLNRVIAEAERHGDLAAVLYLDLDGFKPINDTYGHDVGDQMLVTLVRRLQEATRETDSVARLGGDEFAVLLVRPTDADDVRMVAEKLREEIERPVSVAEGTLRVRVSIGPAVYPADGVTADALLQVADEAMYQEKARRREGAAGPEVG
ncbi:diguanylate cyclase [Guyparkeria halophila]|uniref:Diguanylate cyclase n=1 Tax=Guyparkeria halophila TaxID=47960 RepID=A0ABZ0YTW9_9GAMM|nr:diguanylate cyclase [Guyparkeria halophila]WQH15615.1 diguanylate cyclase [Guyparkeria halophila]